MGNMIIAGVILYGLFFLACYLGTGTDEKNLKSFYSYPKEVQEILSTHEKFKNRIPKKQSTSLVFHSNLMLFSFLFSVIGILLRLSDFEKAFLYFFILGQGLNLFDFFIIDMLWWRNTKRTRFSVIPEAEKYRELSKHKMAFLKGIPLFFAVAAFSTVAVSVILK